MGDMNAVKEPANILPLVGTKNLPPLIDWRVRNRQHLDQNNERSLMPQKHNFYVDNQRLCFMLVIHFAFRLRIISMQNPISTPHNSTFYVNYLTPEFKALLGHPTARL